MAELDNALVAVRDRIARYGPQGIGEQDTKAALIVPVLRALGWDTEDLEDVKLEFKRRPADNPDPPSGELRLSRGARPAGPPECGDRCAARVRRQPDGDSARGRRGHAL